MRKLLLFATIALSSCGGQDESCDPTCGILRNKSITFDVSAGQSRYNFTYDNECSGTRTTKSGYNGGSYHSYLIGDRICSTDIW